MAPAMKPIAGQTQRNRIVIFALALLFACVASSTWSQDGARIVFGAYAGGGDPNIYITTPDGALFEQLTDGGGHDSFPAWSNDGRTIAFPSVRGDDKVDWLARIYLMDADGGNLRPVTEGPDDWGVTFSPRDDAIAYGKWGDDDVGVYVTDLGTDRHTRITDRGTAAMDPSWRPVGDTIVYTSDRAGSYDLHTMAHDGAHQEALTDRRGADGGASWHPRANVIAFVSYGEGGANGNVHTMRADGSDERQITEHPASDNWPRWSPDGTQILFSSRRDGANALFIMDLDGAIVRKVTDERFTVQGADWYDPDAPRSVSPLGRHATTWGWLKRLATAAP